MAAAAELIAEVGWGRVTTRGVAERAGLPHGAVSYHFHGKQEMLIEAAMYGFEQALPVAEFEAIGSVEQLTELILAEAGGQGAVDPLLSGLMMEAMREAERDSVLRERLASALAGYRRSMAEVISAEQQRGEGVAGASAEAIATLIGAMGDGLAMHSALDPALDVGAAVEALRLILRVET